jgi:exosortase/archaeosortase family protein
MVEITAERRRSLRAVLVLGLIYALVSAAHLGDVLAELTQPFVLWTLRILGQAATLHDGGISLGKVFVPWSRDCAGLNVLALLLALTAWMMREQKSLWRYGGSLALAVVVGFFLNVCRILSLVAYRSVFYPKVESPELHYFIGFAWLLPAVVGVALLLGRREDGVTVPDLLYWSVVLSLLSPLVASHGGEIVALSALALLPTAGWTRISRVRGYGLVVWVPVGLIIALAGMESAWLPWVLLCPAFVSWRLIRSPVAWIILAGCVPVLAMNVGMRWCVAVAVLAFWWPRLRTDGNSDDEPVESGSYRWALASIACLLLPFVDGLLPVGQVGEEPPPRGMMAERVDAGRFRLRLLGQAPDLAVTWQQPRGNDRHHGIRICMKFSGVEMLENDSCPGVVQVGDNWVREFFIVDGKLVEDYRDYLLKTWLPLSSVGVHVVVTGSSQLRSGQEFNSEALAVVSEMLRRANSES